VLRRLVLAALALCAASTARALVFVSPLAPHPVPAGLEMPKAERTVEVVVRDERPDKTFLAGSLVSASGKDEKGIYTGFGTPAEGDLATFMTAAGQEAAASIGVGRGNDFRLEIVVRDFRVDLYRRSGWSPMNCMAYGRLGIRLTGPDGAIVREAELPVAYYENEVPGMSMKEVTTEALSRLYAFAAWQATIPTLLDALGITVPAPALRHVEKLVDASKDEERAREYLFWLGLTGRGDTELRGKLLAWYRDSDKQKVHETAIEALALLGASDLRQEIRDRLAGKVKSGGWDMTDNEQVWYLLRALGLLGEKGLEAAIPASLESMRAKVVDLVRWQETGELPKPGPKELKEYEQAKARLAEKRAPSGGGD
jgi:hypothetical protein